MKFKEREINPYSDPVSENNLREGDVYFSIHYIDESMRVPVMGTLIYIGKNLNDGDTDYLYFQDAESFFDGTRYKQSEEIRKGTYWRFPSNESPVLEYEVALEQLMYCSLIRGGKAS